MREQRASPAFYHFIVIDAFVFPDLCFFSVFFLLLDKPFLFTDLTRTGPGPCIDGTQQQQLLNRATIVGHLVTNAEKMAIASLGLQGGALDRGECYSRKVFVGGLPPDIDEGQAPLLSSSLSTSSSSSSIFFFIIISCLLYYHYSHHNCFHFMPWLCSSFCQTGGGHWLIMANGEGTSSKAGPRG